MKQRSLILLMLVFLALAASACATLPPVLVAPTPIGGQTPVEPVQVAPVPASAAPEAELPAGPNLNDPLPLDPAVRVGKLDNGLTYYVQRNTEPANRAELWLAVNAGSVLEEDDQQGLAHFLEHMLFNGTRRFPEQDLIAYLESTGMEFGPDINAYTSFDETVYMLQVPTDQDEILVKAFDVLEDWAGSATLSPEEIDKERGVILEEQRLRDQNADGRIDAKVWPVLSASSPYTNRLPIGDLDVIRNAPPEAIRRFYETWYRPDLMAVVAVGDFDVDRIETLIKEHFSSLPEATNPTERPSFDIPTQEQPRVLIVTDPEYPYTELSITTVHPSHPILSAGDFRDWLVSDLFDTMLNGRLEEISRKPDAPFLYAWARSQDLARPAETYALQAQVSAGEVLAGIEALLTEVERVRKHGFTETELKRAKQDLLRAYDRYYLERENIDSRAFADGYVDHFLTGGASPSVELLAQLARQLVPDISIDEVSALAFDRASDRGRVLVVTAPEQAKAKLPSEDALAGVFDAVAAKAVDPYVDQVAGAAGLMAEPPAPVAIVAERTVPELGVTEITLANGVRVIMKQTDFRENEVIFSATSPGGSSLVADTDFPEADAAAYLVSQSGIGELSQTELQKLLSGKTVGVAPGVFELSEGFSGYAATEDLETAMQLIHLYATQPRLDPAFVEDFKKQARADLVNRQADPYAVFEDALKEALYGNSIRRGVLPLPEIERLDATRSLEIYRERFGDTSDFTFTFVGNFDEEELKQLAQRYLGALPAAGRQESWNDVTPALPGGVVEKDVKKGQDQQSLVQLVFTGPISATEQVQVQLEALERVLDIRLRDALREELSGTYAPFVAANLSTLPQPRYSVSIGFGTDPNRVDELVNAMFQAIGDLKANGPTEEEVTTVQEQLRRNREEAQESNDFWLSQLEYYFTTPGEDPMDILGYDRWVNAVTPGDIQDAARATLPDDRYVKVVLYPEKLD